MTTRTRLRVLLVEDVEDDAALSLLKLAEGGYAPIHERVDTREAMNAALDRGPWDIVLSDQSMPCFDASGALRLLVERGFDVPFIVVSGSIDDATVVSLMKGGAYDYITKNAIHELGPAVKSALRDARERAESKRAAIALKESEQRFSLAVLGSRDGIWDWSIQSGTTYYSARFLEMLGAEEHELTGPLDAFLALVHEDDREAVRRALQSHLDRRAPFDVDMRVRTKGGEFRWFSFRGQALWDGAGTATRMAGSLSDITERRGVEERLKEQLALIHEQQKAIRTLSTPLIEVWDGVLMVPVLGLLDAMRAQEMMESLLPAVRRTGCHHAIIDLTGVPSMDAATADHVIKVVSAVELLGARGVVVGIQPQVAQAIVSIGADLSGIATLGSVRDALLHCMQRSVSSPPTYKEDIEFLTPDYPISVRRGLHRRLLLLDDIVEEAAGPHRDCVDLAGRIS